MRAKAPEIGIQCFRVTAAVILASVYAGVAFRSVRADWRLLPGTALAGGLCALLFRCRPARCSGPRLFSFWSGGTWSPSIFRYGCLSVCFAETMGRKRPSIRECCSFSFLLCTCMCRSVIRTHSVCPFLAGACSLALSVQSEENRSRIGHQTVLGALLGGVLCLGFQIRGSLIVLLIACAIVFLFRFRFREFLRVIGSVLCGAVSRGCGRPASPAKSAS